MHELLKRIKYLYTVAEIEDGDTKNTIAAVALNRKLMGCEIVTIGNSHCVKLVDAWFYRDSSSLYAITDWRYVVNGDTSGPRIDAMWVKEKNIVINISPRADSDQDGVAGCELYPTLRIPLSLTISGDECMLRSMGANIISNHEVTIDGLGDELIKHKKNLPELLISTLNFVCDSVSPDDVASVSENVANEI